jgi:hypothetical protein
MYLKDTVVLAMLTLARAEWKETYYRGKRDLLYVHLKDTVVLDMLTLARADFEKGSALAAREGDIPEPAGLKK